MRRVLILGFDGYIGWALTNNLLTTNRYEVAGADNYSRRYRVQDLGSDSLTLIRDKVSRLEALNEHDKFIKDAYLGNIDRESFFDFIREIKPDVIIHLAEQPSAPWSMAGVNEAMETQRSNVLGTLNLLHAMAEHCPDAHLIKLGSMGEYGTPDCDIPEGMIPKSCMNSGDRDCMLGGLPFPRSPGSWYHLSKVHDTHNIIFACNNYGLTSTDIMQGVVFGLNQTDPTSPYITRFDYDECFGTAINRFCLQAVIEHPITVYGSGKQTRGYLPLRDSLQCIQLAIDNPPPKGTYRTLNQFENVYKLNELADLVVRQANQHLGIHAGIDHLPNPRKESESHYYNPAHQTLFDLGYKPSDMEVEVAVLLRQLNKIKSRAIPEVIMPYIKW